MNYEKLEKSTTKWIEIYKKCRADNPWDYECFKNVSDELSEALVFFGPRAAEFGRIYERAKIDRELYFEERKLYWQDVIGKAHGNGSEIAAKAKLDCKEKYYIEIDAQADWRKANQIIDRIDQELNSISRRFKEIKHDEDSN